MLTPIQDWFGLSPQRQSLGLGHGHDDGKGHGHTHGMIDPTIATTAQGIWAIKWSIVVLAITSILQVGVVAISGSVALLADTIHNVGDAVTAIPLCIAFMLARRKPSKNFTYGLGRSQHRILSLKSQIRPEWRSQDGQSETEQPDHSTSLGNSVTSSTRMRFPAHTAGLYESNVAFLARTFSPGLVDFPRAFGH